MEIILNVAIVSQHIATTYAKYVAMTIANYIQYKSCTCKLKCYDTPHQAPSKSYRYIVSPC